MLTSRKIRRIVQDYFDDLFKRAGIKDFVAEEQRKAKIEALKRKSDIVIETNQGDIELKLFPESAPFACENFVGLVEKGYYDGLIFHRVKKDFMIQGGDPTGTGAGGESIWKEPFRDEINEKLTFDKPGVLAMANSGPDTNKSQFFITSAPAAWLNGRHTIFGELVSGMETVKKIESSPIDSTDKPKEDQKIIRMRVKTPAN
ncbi:MAG: peptidylprolyl isomerase [Candidatus Omnitrophica bacterium]|nr:peptidylprolyl isomerase [Candidatus Omnitrophota bacterium]